MISCLARELRRRDCYDRETMIKIFKDAYHANVNNEGGKSAGHGFHLETASNISEWLEEYLADFSQTRTRKGVAQFHQFKAHMVDGEAVSVREWCGDVTEAWRGLEDGTLYHKVHT